MAAFDSALLARRLQQLVDETGGVDRAVDRVVAEQNAPKRVVQAIACGMDLMPERYDRNAGTLGCAGQKRLLESRALVAGVGGLGGYVAEELARSGMGTLVGVDSDRFDETNLNRQLFADRSSLGLAKTEAARTRLADVNDAVEFLPHFCALEDLPETAYEHTALLFDCLDRIPSKLHLQEMGERYDIPLVHGAIGGWYGQVAVVWPKSRLLSNLYGGKQEGIERELGNPSFTPAVVASLMVAEGIKVLLEKGTRENAVIFLDLLHNQWETIPL